jgi:cyclomaltodextrinase
MLKGVKPFFLLLCAIANCSCILAAEIILHKTNATVWLPRQIIKGELMRFTAKSVRIECADSSFDVPVSSAGTFLFTVHLKKGLNTIVATAESKDSTIRSIPLHLTLPYNPLPFLVARATIAGDSLRLHHSALEDAYRYPVAYKWQAAANNPEAVRLISVNDSVAVASLPKKDGEYYFTLFATVNDATDSFKTFVSVNHGKSVAFQIEHDMSSWIDTAIIYQVTPYIFTDGRKFKDITAKLVELQQLGVNTIYLQPVYATDRGGQGYDVVDFFSVRSDLGPEKDLDTLVSQAHAMGMRVLFDMVPNHTSINHPYAKDKIVNGERSHYYSFYQTRRDSVMYAMHYNDHPDGFIYYFWKPLVNLDFNNEEVQRWMIEACKHWVRKYNIDGYRFDAVWGVNARTPAFAKRLRMELKSLKPDILLIAEDKAVPSTYELGFDAAYDWDRTELWVSKWAWQYEYDAEHAKTIFNHPSLQQRKQLLRTALFSDGDSIGLRLRYLENNDLHRFISNHTPAVTRMAATMMFSLPGLPMLYNGQETGFRKFPYTSGPIYASEKGIRMMDSTLFDFYGKLAAVRKANVALYAGKMREVELDDAPSCVAFVREHENQQVLVIVNLSEAAARTKISYAVLGNQKLLQFRNLVNGLQVKLSRKKNRTTMIDIPAASTLLLGVVKARPR